MRSRTGSARAASPEPGSEVPLALIESGPRGLRITAVDHAAARAGIHPGQALADARAGLPGLRTRPAEPRRDAALLQEIAHWIGRYGPCRNVDGVDGLWVDTAGVAHLFGGEERLLGDCRDRLIQACFSTRLGVADTPAAAWALARYGGSSGGIACAAPGQTRAALAPLPVEALRLTEATIVLLKRLGLYRIGDLYGLPRASLARRFRDLRRSDVAELADGVILRLDQALGDIRDPRTPMMPPPCRLVRRVFAEPLITSAALEVAVADLVGALVALLAGEGMGARRLLMVLYRTDGTRATLAIGTSTASRDAGHLERLLQEKLDSIDLGFGVDVITFEALQAEPLDALQSSLTAKPAQTGGQGLAELVDRLANRIGAGSLYRATPQPSHIPEQADAAVPFTAPASSGSPLAGTAPRPPFLLPRPEPIEVVAEVPEGPPRRFLWRRARHRIVKAEGPERIEPAWWQSITAPAAATACPRPRDYYRIEDDAGGRFWVFRDGLYDRGDPDHPPLWYVHGLFG